MTITWNGRAFVTEESITPEQYKMFFGKDEYGIKYDIANMILHDMLIGESEEVVPCDELCNESRIDIANAIMDGHNCGRLQMNGQTLSWAWEPELTSEGEEISFSDLSSYALDKIAHQMLEDEAHWGIVEI